MSAIDTLLNVAPRYREGMRQGPNHIMVRCPFHGGGNERTPSLSISLSVPVWFCHGCKTSGHIAQLLAAAGLSRSSISAVLPRTADQPYKKQTLAAKITNTRDLFRGKFILDEGLLDTYRLCPTSLVQAGFKQSTLRHFEVGYDAPNVRITYPLRNIYGELVGISGRANLEGIEPRYKIYEKELIARADFNVPPNYSMEAVKSAILWHGHVVRPLFFADTYHADFMVLTEGFKACMWTWQNGFEDVVALVGSYLTDHHAELIGRVVPRVVMFLDNNEAGWRGTHLASRKLLAKGVDVFVARYPDDREQPDNLIENEIEAALLDPEPLRAWARRHPMYESPRDLLRKIKRAAWYENEENQ